MFCLNHVSVGTRADSYQEWSNIGQLPKQIAHQNGEQYILVCRKRRNYLTLTLVNNVTCLLIWLLPVLS